MSQTWARRGELPLIGSLGVWLSTRLRLALPGPKGGKPGRSSSSQGSNQPCCPLTTLGVERVVELGPGADGALRCPDLDPVPLGDAARGGGVRVQLDGRIGNVAAQAGDLAVLGLAEVQCLVAGEHEREVVGQVRPGSRAQRRLGEGGERRLTDVEEALDVELDPSGGRGEPGGPAVVAGSLRTSGGGSPAGRGHRRGRRGAARA